MTAYVVASGTAAARLETLLRRDPALRVVVLDPSALATRDVSGEDAIVIVALAPEATARVLERLRGRPVIIVLSSRPQDFWTSRARRSGVRAVLAIDVTGDELAAAIAATRAGLLVLDEDAVTRTAPAPAGAPVAPSALTSREVEVLEMLAEGMSNRAIAARLKISRNTVKFHVAAILEKLGARTRTEAVTLGVRQGLISL